MHKHTITKMIWAVSVLILGCTVSEVPEGLLYEMELLTLGWDPSPTEDGGSVSPDSYALYYRRRGDSSWRFVAAIAASYNPEYTLHYDDFGTGTFEFGVIAVDSQGSRSQMHTSTDSDTNPGGGWVLTWKR